MRVRIDEARGRAPVRAHRSPAPVPAEPTAVMRPSVTSTSAANGGEPEPSMTAGVADDEVSGHGRDSTPPPEGAEPLDVPVPAPCSTSAAPVQRLFARPACLRSGSPSPAAPDRSPPLLGAAGSPSGTALELTLAARTASLFVCPRTAFCLPRRQVACDRSPPCRAQQAQQQAVAPNLALPVVPC